MSLNDLRNITDHAWLAIPICVWFLTSLVQVGVRRDAWHFFTKDFPRIGSEFCKIALTIMLGAIAIELRSPQFSSSMLAKNSSPLLLTLLTLFIIVFFFLSFVCFHVVEGKRPRWRPRRDEISWPGWLFKVALAEAFGIGPLAFVIYSLEGRL